MATEIWWDRDGEFPDQSGGGFGEDGEDFAVRVMGASHHMVVDEG